MVKGDTVVITEVNEDNFAYAMGVRPGCAGIVMAPCCICSSGHHEDAACILTGIKDDKGNQYAFCCSKSILQKVTYH